MPSEERRRSRRSVKYNFPYIIDRKIYLELLVVVDIEMEKFYGEGLENHVLTLLFLVSFTSYRIFSKLIFSGFKGV